MKHISEKLTHTADLSPTAKYARIAASTPPDYTSDRQRAVAYANQTAGTQFTFSDAAAPIRRKKYVEFRQAVQWYLRTECAWSYPKIGHYCGGRDHASVMHLVRKHNKQIGVGV